MVLRDRLLLMSQAFLLERQVEAAAASGIDKVRIIETDGDEVIAVRRTGLTEESKVGLALADNRTAELAMGQRNA